MIPKFPLWKASCRTYVLTLIAPSIVAASCTAMAATTDSILGTWIFKTIVASSPITGLDDQGIRNLRGEALKIESTMVTFEQRECRQPKFRFSRTDARRFFKDYRIEPPASWQGTVERVDVTCANADVLGPFLLKGDSLVFVWYGVALRMRRAAP